MGEQDLGLAAVKSHFERAMVDREWSVCGERGYTWWGRGLAQTIWSEPARREEGDQIWLLRARTDLLRKVADTPEVRNVISTLNKQNPLSAVVFEPEAGTVKLASSFPIFDVIAPWAGAIFSWAAAIQADAAHALVQRGIAEVLGGEPDETAHPTSGRREAPDDMLGMIASEVLAREDDASACGGDEFELIVNLARSKGIYANAGSTGLTAEFPFGGHTGLLRSLFGPKGKPLTALYTMRTDQPHPVLGRGCRCRLFLPVDLERAAVEDLANRMNQAETTRWAYLYAMGAWCVDEASGGVECLTHVTFLPTVVCQRGLLTNVFVSEELRVGWAKTTFEL